MPILIQCTNCQRNLRVQDHLLGKTVKCPNCQIKFLAQVVEEGSSLQPTAAPEPQPSLANDGTVRSLAEEMLKTPVLPPMNPVPVQPGLGLQILEITQPASSPSGISTNEPRSAERVSAAVPASPTGPEVAAPAAIPLPRPPQPFQTPFLRVLAVVGVIVLLAAFAGCGVGWWVGAAVENAAATSKTP